MDFGRRNVGGRHMIKIIKGVYGYRNKNGVIEPKTAESPAFSLTEEQEMRLVKRKVAVFVENQEVAPVQQELLEEQLENMNFNDLKKLAKEKGIEQGKKEEMIAAILELEEHSEEDTEDNPPELDAQIPS